MTLPDRLTVLRLVLIAPAAALIALGLGLHSPTLLYLGAAIFAIAALSDAIDGPLARRLGCESRFGRVADPVSDKLLILACLASLSAFGAAPALPSAIIGLREIGSLGLWALSASLAAPLSPNVGGKTKFFMQCVAVEVLAIEAALRPTGAGLWMAWAAAAWTAATGVSQWVRSRRLWRALGDRLRARRAPGRAEREEA